MSLELALTVGLIGLLASFLSGLLGIGGGLVIIPLLLYLPGLFGLPTFDVKAATAIGVAQIATATGSGTIAHLRRGNVYKRLAIVIISAMVLGALGGGWASQFVPSHALLVLFAAMATLGASAMLLPVHSQEKRPPQPPFNAPLALLCGLLVGTGIGLVGGGGFLLVPLQVYALGIPTRTAIATGLAASFPSALSGLLGKTLGGQLQLGPAVIACLPAIPGAQLGAAVGVRLSSRFLRRLYAVLILLVASGLWWDVLHAA